MIENASLNNVQSSKQSDIAEKIGIDERSYANYKKLTTLVPELQDMVDVSPQRTNN